MYGIRRPSAVLSRSLRKLTTGVMIIFRIYGIEVMKTAINVLEAPSFSISTGSSAPTSEDIRKNPNAPTVMKKTVSSSPRPVYSSEPARYSGSRFSAGTVR